MYVHPAVLWNFKEKKLVLYITSFACVSFKTIPLIPNECKGPFAFDTVLHKTEISNKIIF